MNDVEPSYSVKRGENGWITRCDNCGMKVFYQNVRMYDDNSYHYWPFNMEMGSHRNKHSCCDCPEGCGEKLVRPGWIRPDKPGYYVSVKTKGPLEHRCRSDVGGIFPY